MLTSEGRGGREVGGDDRRGQGKLSQRHLLVFDRVETVLMNIHEWRRLDIVPIQRLNWSVSEAILVCTRV